MKPKSIGKQIKRLEWQYYAHEGNVVKQLRIARKINDLKNKEK